MTGDQNKDLTTPHWSDPNGAAAQPPMLTPGEVAALHAERNKDLTTLRLPEALVERVERFAFVFYVPEPNEADEVLRQVAAHLHNQRRS